MAETNKLPRTVRGKRPEFFKDAGVDDAISMVLAVAQELQVLRERVDTAERIMANKGIDLAAEIEAFELDEETLKIREEKRQEFYRRIFYLNAQRRAELENKDSDKSYTDTLDKVAQGDL